MPGPERTYLFRVPYYDFLLQVLKNVGSSGSRYIHTYARTYIRTYRYTDILI